MPHKHTVLLTNVIAEENNEEGGHQVIDALHVATGRSSDGPDVKDPLKSILAQLLLEEGHTGVHAGDINVDLGTGEGEGGGIRGTDVQWHAHTRIHTHARARTHTHLPVGPSMQLIKPCVVVLRYEVLIFPPLPSNGLLPAINVGWEVALRV